MHVKLEVIDINLNVYMDLQKIVRTSSLRTVVGPSGSQNRDPKLSVFQTHFKINI